MAAPVVERSTGDTIPASDHNDVKDYIEDGTYRVNTLSLSVGGTEIIDSSRNISLDAGKKISMAVPTADGTATGPQTNAFVSGYTSSAVGDLVYLDSDGKWQLTDADAEATTTGLLGIALEVKAADAALLVALPGSMVYSTAFITFTVGAPIYVGETAGAMQLAIPTGTDGTVRVVGFGIHADKLYFMPSSDVATIT